MNSNLYSDISNNYYNEQKQTIDYDRGNRDGSSSTGGGGVGTHLPAITSPGKQQQPQQRMEKSNTSSNTNIKSTKKKKKKDVSPPKQKSRIASNSGNNSTSTNSSTNSINVNRSINQKREEPPGKAIVLKARQMSGGNSESMNRPHSRSEKQLIQR